MRTDRSQTCPALKRLKVFLWKVGAKAPTAQACYTDLVTGGAIRIRLPEALLGRGAIRKARSLHAIQRRFAKRFGLEVELQIREGVRPVWGGPVRFIGMEMPRGEDTDVGVTLAFVEPLGDGDLRALGLLEPSTPTPREQPAVPEDKGHSLPVAEPRNAAGEQPLAPAGADSRRLAARLNTDVPLAIHTATGTCNAEMQDLSRTGLRLHVRAVDLGFTPTRDLHEIAVGVEGALKQSFHVDLNHNMLGSLLRKFVHMTRLSISRESAALVEICGRFERPLKLEETTMLGLPLPPLTDSSENWNPAEEMVGPMARAPGLPALLPRILRAPPPERDVPEAGLERDVSSREPSAAPESAIPCQADAGLEEADSSVDAFVPNALGFTITRRVRAHVRAETGDLVPCQTDALGYEGVRVRMARTAILPDGVDALEGIAHAAALFRETFGSLPNTKLVDGADHLWTGPTRLVALDLLQESPADMWVTLSFNHALRPAEIRRLGLPAMIA